eukprot:TRINITY_DN21710_c0_g1_i1.p1 TRINITY_DN21710_c0_g1~~TRINITY_DN21710_c0_g1_i1.p1  ORF type:complete len:286 (+),score=43.18 TRINITY_DN21710_c0_g1_i1:134-991(+)
MAMKAGLHAVWGMYFACAELCQNCIWDDGGNVALVQMSGARVGNKAALAQAQTQRSRYDPIHISQFVDATEIDENGHLCNLCSRPSKGNYKPRSDCGNHSMDEWLQNPLDAFKPVVEFLRSGSSSLPATNGYCELNLQKYCADSIYNKDFLFQAKSQTNPDIYDFVYCKHNGYLKPEILALQHDFEGTVAKSDEYCSSDRLLSYGWNSTMSAATILARYFDGVYPPTEDDSFFMAAMTCAMGSAGCDMAFCAYTFCDKGNGTYGVYDECEGWDSEKGMPMSHAQP